MKNGNERFNWTTYGMDYGWRLEVEFEAEALLLFDLDWMKREESIYTGEVRSSRARERWQSVMRGKWWLSVVEAFLVCGGTATWRNTFSLFFFSTTSLIWFECHFWLQAVSAPPITVRRKAFCFAHFPFFFRLFFR
jgi:hypothetical protein